MQSLLRRLLGGLPPSADRFPLVSAAGRLQLRPIQESDHALIAHWFGDFDSCRLAFGVDADTQTLAGMTREYIKELREDATGVLMILWTPTATLAAGAPPVGFLRYKLFRQSRRNLARVGIFLGTSANRGQGLGSEAMSTLLEYLFVTRGIETVELDTAHFNQAAQACFLKCGFQAVQQIEVSGLNDDWSERRIIMRQTSKQWRTAASP